LFVPIGDDIVVPVKPDTDELGTGPTVNQLPPLNVVPLIYSGIVVPSVVNLSDSLKLLLQIID